MKYIQESFLGKPLFYASIPFMQTVNNGYIIYTQSADLIKQLQENEINGGEVIDWNLFKTGKTILVDNKGFKHGCIASAHNNSIELKELISRTHYRVRFSDNDMQEKCVPISLLIKADSEKEAIEKASVVLSQKKYKILDAKMIQEEEEKE